MKVSNVIKRGLFCALLCAVNGWAIPTMASQESGAARKGGVVKESAADKAAADATDVDFRWGVKIPMRDGKLLTSTLYKSASDTGPMPVIFGMTPYTSDSYHPFAMYFAKRGYIFLVVDARGRGNSEGEFHPFLQDAHDGFDVVEWIAKQPWSNGKVTMFGGSYSGSNQWATAKEFPKNLTTIIPTAPAYAGVDFPALNNIFRSYNIQWLTFTSGAAGNANIFRDGVFWTRHFKDLYQGKVAFKDFDDYVGNPLQMFDTWVSHPHPDAYYDSMTPTEEEFNRLALPILSVTGHYDGDQPGTMEFYRRHMRMGAPEAIAQHYLVIGPWDHGGTRTPQQMVGGVDLGAESLLEINALNKQWYDWTMKNGPKPEFLQDRVAYYVVGANTWKYASSLEEVGAEKLELYLDANGVASPSAYSAGKLTPAAPGKAQTAYYIDNPLATAKTLEQVKALAENPIEGLVYQSDVLDIEDEGLVYLSAPMPEPTEISGYLKLILWLSMDVRDTDFRARLYEILPDGKSILLTDDIERARYRESNREEKLVTPGKVERYEFQNFKFFSRQIGKGSRLRLVFDGNDTIESQQNFNAGGVVAEETAKDARTATVTVHQSKQHRSVLILPLGK